MSNRMLPVERLAFTRANGTRVLPRALIAVLAVLVGSLALAASARIQVPFWPVPMTMQVAVTLLIGASCGPRLAAATVGAYLLEGALGLPVFASGAGLVYMAGPTGGYLAGFFAAAVIAGVAAQAGLFARLSTALAAMVAATAVLYALGLGWLVVGIGLAPAKAVAVGLVPFLPAEALKIALATAGALQLYRRRS
ncbi:biotin transporter BioY [Radicibacter daui]|uniref:biotin transporter BioY n=1 Tax=Radicibacter daui TaxID=3064829 RepID=UPI0040468FBE